MLLFFRNQKGTRPCFLDGAGDRNAMDVMAARSDGFLLSKNRTCARPISRCSAARVGHFAKGFNLHQSECAVRNAKHGLI